MEKTKILYDGDMGGDDLWAIAMLLAHRDRFDIRGIASVFGNVSQPFATRNIANFLHWLGVDDIETVQGADTPCDGMRPFGDDAYGEGGVGGVILPESPQACPTVDIADWYAAKLDEAMPDPSAQSGTAASGGSALYKAAQNGTALDESAHDKTTQGGTAFDGSTLDKAPQDTEKFDGSPLEKAAQGGVVFDRSAPDISAQGGVALDGSAPDKTAQGDAAFNGAVPDKISGKAPDKASGPVTVLATGPITNLALFAQKYPQKTAKIREIIWMGGGMTPPGKGGKPVLLENGAIRSGNIMPYAEFNAYQDPKALNILLETGIRIVFMAADASQNMVLTPERQDRIAAIDSLYAPSFHRMLMAVAALDMGKFGVDGPFIHDPNVAIYALRPDLYKGRAVPALAFHEAEPASEHRGEALECGKPDGKANAFWLDGVTDTEEIFTLMLESLKTTIAQAAENRARLAG
ncbi:MAG: nucleoside hydrolase [Micavibrio sp.]